ncbi:MAG TPA: hypothetical protein DD670_02055 [Planctomycetaceae bacterium]|nr:hypothetical protein [Planctomycetaceae bacterium]
MRNEKELLIDCLDRLNRSSIAYMLTGSMASNYWGIPRTTHDLDFVLVMRPDDIEGFTDAFRDGFFLQPESVRQAFKPPYQFNAIDEFSALKVDFWLLGDNPFENHAFARRLKATLFDSSAWIMTAEDVILHKLYWNRLTPSERQLGDAAGVFAVQGLMLDVDYLRQWAPTLDVQSDLDALIEGRIRPKTT